MTEISVDRLSSEADGVWRITTMGSVHIWNMDEADIRYVRENVDGFNPFFFDGDVVTITKVIRWPAVNDTFEVFNDTRSGWHRSSYIRSIVKVTPEA